MSGRSRSGARASRGRVARRRRLGLRGALVGVALAWLAVGCTPLYLPPVPSELPVIEARLRLDDVRVDRLGGVPAVAFVPAEVPEPGWIAVQWFPPSGGEVGSGSVWLDAGRVGRVLRLPFPDDVPRERDGRWRALLSFEGEIVRQLEWREPAEP